MVVRTAAALAILVALPIDAAASLPSFDFALDRTGTAFVVSIVVVDTTRLVDLHRFLLHQHQYILSLQTTTVAVGIGRTYTRMIPHSASTTIVADSSTTATF